MTDTQIAIPAHAYSDRPTNTPPPVSSIPPNAIHCRCGAWWTGLTAGHCSACHHTFTSIAAFDIHRTGSHARGERHCLNPADVRRQDGEPALVPANKAWPGWSLPGTWEGPTE